MVIKVTDHALARYEQRVSSKDNFKPNFREIVRGWFAASLNEAKHVRWNRDGTRVWAYENWHIVTNQEKNVVITVAPKTHAPGTVPEDVEKTIMKTIKRTFMRLVRPLQERKHSIIVEIHSNELKRLRVHNPQTKKIISGRIDALNSELDEVMKDISAHSALAYRYKVNIETEVD